LRKTIDFLYKHFVFCWIGLFAFFGTHTREHCVKVIHFFLQNNVSGFKQFQFDMVEFHVLSYVSNKEIVFILNILIVIQL